MFFGDLTLSKRAAKLSRSFQRDSSVLPLPKPVIAVGKLTRSAFNSRSMIRPMPAIMRSIKPIILSPIDSQET